MPRNTRSSAASRKPVAEQTEEIAQSSSHGGKGKPAPAKGKVLSSTKKLVSSGSTSPGVYSSPARIETTKKSIPSTLPPPVTQKTLAVPGSRMGRAKHSGLLAKDEESIAASEPDLGASNLGLALGFSPTSEPARSSTGVDPSGREIYTIKKQPRRGKTGKGLEKTPGGSGARLGKRERDGGCALGGDINETKGARKTADVLESSEEEEEKMEVDKPTSSSLSAAKNKTVQSQESEFHDSEDDDEDLSDVSDDGEGLPSIAAILNRGETVAHATEDMVEGYFTAHSGKTGPTSDHTLSKLSRPKMDQQSVQDALRAAPATPTRLQADCQSLLEEYRSLFPYWLFQMNNGFNVLLYGLGSKQSLLEDFRKQYLTNTCHLVVNGYFPGLSVKHILTKLSCDVLGHSGAFKSYTEQAQFICSKFEDGQRSGNPSEVFLLIHNIDGPMLRGEKAQSALSYLAQSPSIHLLCSIDHINAPLIWDQNRLSRFNWIWHDVTTYESYREETSFENSLLVQQSGTLALSSLTHVMRSLTPNARGIFELLAKYQLEAKKSGEGGEGGAMAAAGTPYIGLSFQDFYIRSREKFLVNSDLTLRAQLTEFRDHKLIQSKKGSDGVEYLYIPVDDSTLAQFLEQQDEGQM